MIEFDEAGRFGVELLPYSDVLINMVLLDGKVYRVSHVQERIHDDSDEQIEENLGDDQLEHEEERVSFG